MPLPFTPSVTEATLPSPYPKPLRDPEPMFQRALQQWGGKTDFWVFAYASLIWRPDFSVAEQHLARVHGWHRALKMWSRVNRGTVECPGLVFALLSGGSCQGAVLRVRSSDGERVLRQLWDREMVTGVYDPKWLDCRTDRGTVRALAFTLSRQSPNYTGELPAQRYREVFSGSCGRYGTTLEYARQTLHTLHQHGIDDHALRQLLRHAR